MTAHAGSVKSVTVKAGILGATLACAALFAGTDAKSDAQSGKPGGVAAVYGHVSPDQVEFLTTPERLKNVAASGVPTAIWEALEHGEKVECLDCIAVVEPLLYDTHAKTREIAAWWLRRRVFGVFGPGEVYARTLGVLKSDADPVRRANAASALGEFLTTPGIAACADALKSDSDARVRASAASALGRLNDDGGGALVTALGDADEHVRLAAITAAGRVSNMSNVVAATAALGKLTLDASATVRRRAVERLDGMRAKDAASSVLAIAKSDPDENVRIAACHALGAFHDKSAQATLEQIAESDASGLVRDQATIALRRL